MADLKYDLNKFESKTRPGLESLASGAGSIEETEQMIALEKQNRQSTISRLEQAKKAR